ncbi:MAG: TAXI family TRAP transporter solute-binding subunit [Desulfomonile tiedjei]|uniref:TAXI family TRAP transporter solute-binding subunit n=1 Tax=Desulfomonile tiedjei TaxID=2358 RepID=A0A9D6UZ76_9BACT|nr:TAXI family TRAP transporter solute-binding subunit [Desulfomonile tiedjei]
MTCVPEICPPKKSAGRNKRLIVFLVIICLLSCFLSESFSQTRDPARISILIATGMPGGTYYHVGLGMASLWTTRLREAGIRVSAAMSEGSMENIEAIRIADADLILVEDLFCSMAVTGTGLFRGQPVPELRSITALWPDVLHLLIRSDKISTGALQDLDGLSLATGLPDSGNRFVTELLLRSLKGSRPKPRLRPMSNLAAAEALRKGLVDGIDFTGGVPIPLVAQLFNEGKSLLGFLEISEGQMESVREEGWKNVFRVTIPAGSYSGQEKPVNTLGHTNMLAVTSSLNPDVVYALTKSLYENLDYLIRVHPACKSISLEKALEKLNVPLHKGALRYYKERKIKIPEHLIH